MKIQKNIYLVLALTYGTYGHGKLEKTVPPAAAPIILHNQHTIDQHVVLAAPKTDPTDCTQLQGTQMMDCMACQSSVNLKKNLMNFNDRMASLYFKQLSIEQYHEALQNFTESDWQAFFASRNPESQDGFPKTLEEQRVMLKKAYLHFYFDSFFDYWWSGQSEFKTDDLEKLIAAYYAKCLKGQISYAVHGALTQEFRLNRMVMFSKKKP